MDLYKILFFALIILVLAIYILLIVRKNKNKDLIAASTEDNNYMTEGMTIGMCLGMAISMLIDADNMAIGLSIGMMLGMVIGMNIKKWFKRGALMYDIYIQLAIFLAFVFVLKMFLPKIKGHMGESIVKIKLNSLDKEKYKVINNLVLENAGGTTKSTQIDHLVVSTYGIFSIETKNYKGWIYGSEFGKNWTQNIYGNKKTFMNPILQNYAHIKAVENILKDLYPNMKYFSIIAFSPEAEIKVKLKESVVCKMSQVSKEIEKLSNEDIIDKDELEKILEIIQGNRLNISNRDHVKNIKEAKKNKLKTQTGSTSETKKSPSKKIEKSEESKSKITKEEVKEKEAKLDMKKEKNESIKLCPKCGSPLEIRTGRYGSFLGCTNYPTCTYVESIKA